MIYKMKEVIRMAPRQKITKDMILEAGYELAKKNGIENVNSRNVAKELSCSTQPVFSQFPTMEELRKAVFDYACEKCVYEILKNKDKKDFLNLTTRWYLNLIRKEKNLYKLIFFSSGFERNSVIEMMLTYDSNKELINKIQLDYSLKETQCNDILLRTFSLLHGIGSLIAFNDLQISDDEISGLIKKTVIEMVQGISKSNIKEE